MLCTLRDPIVFTSMEYIKFNNLSQRVWRDLVMSERGSYIPRISEKRSLYKFQIPFQTLTGNPNLLNYVHYIRAFVIGVRGRFRLYLCNIFRVYSPEIYGCICFIQKDSIRNCPINKKELSQNISKTLSKTTKKLNDNGYNFHNK
jgi:uncharacterized protein (UPF0297 family)